MSFLEQMLEEFKTNNMEISELEKFLWEFIEESQKIQRSHQKMLQFLQQFLWWSVKCYSFGEEQTILS